MPLRQNASIMKTDHGESAEDACKADVIARASRIVLDATEIDWRRDPLTEYEAEVRRTWLADQMNRGPFGRIEIADLAFGMDEMGTDLREALDGVFMLAEVHAVRRQRRSLRCARDAVNRAEPRT